jgi:hypothetical protein
MAKREEENFYQIILSDSKGHLATQGIQATDNGSTEEGSRDR